jgi:hypothetical protein
MELRKSLNPELVVEPEWEAPLKTEPRRWVGMMVKTLVAAFFAAAAAAGLIAATAWQAKQPIATADAVEPSAAISVGVGETPPVTKSAERVPTARAEVAPSASDAPAQQVQMAAASTSVPESTRAPLAAVPSMPALNAGTAAEPLRLEKDELDSLVRRGEDLIRHGDISAARIVFKRAAEAGDTRAALGLGRTFDPAVLRRMGAVGVRPEPDQARYWYEKAAAAGSGEALKLLTSLR